MHDEFDIHGPKFNEAKLLQAMAILSIPTRYFVTDPSQITIGERCIMLMEKDQGKSVVSFVGRSGKVILHSVPMMNQLALFYAFREVYLLYLYETEVKKLFISENIKNDISEEEIYIFL